MGTMWDNGHMLNILQIILSIVLITVIVLQAKGTGLGSAFGGSAGYHTKRGAEKFLFNATIVLSVLFIIVSFYNSLVK